MSCLCENIEEGNYAKLDDAFHVTGGEMIIYRDNNKWGLEVDKDSNVIAIIHIKYCPLCGRELP